MNKKKFQDKMLEDEVDPLPLFEAHRWPYRPQAKAPYRDTSVAAARQVTVKHNSLKGRCLRLLAEHGPRTADELAEMLQESVLNVRPACSALVSLARIIDSGERRLNASHNTMIVWRLRQPEDAGANLAGPTSSSPGAT